MTDIKVEWEEPAILGEGPSWIERDNAIYWVDIVGKKLHRYSLADGDRRTWQFDEQVTSIAARQQGGYVCTIREGYAFIDIDTGQIEPIAQPELDLPGNRFNDGKLDAQGRYWAGTMDEAEKLDSGVLYRLDADLSIHTVDDRYIITNGPAFSPDGKTMYHNDTIKRCIYAMDCDAAGSISKKRVFAQLEGDQGYPDGLTVDAEGCIWQCSFGGHRITRFSPMGEILQVLEMPVPNVTSCTFGGPDLDTLYITTARYLLSDEEIANYPLAGSLFSYKPGVQGLSTPLFAG